MVVMGGGQKKDVSVQIKQILSLRTKSMLTEACFCSFLLQVGRHTRRRQNTSTVSFKTWINGRPLRRSTPTSLVPRTPRTCSLCLTPSPTSLSRTTWVRSGCTEAFRPLRWVKIPTVKVFGARHPSYARQSGLHPMAAPTGCYDSCLHVCSASLCIHTCLLLSPGESGLLDCCTASTEDKSKSMRCTELVASQGAENNLHRLRTWDHDHF